MRALVWVLFLISLSGLLVWIVVHLGVIESPPLLFLLFAFFGAPNIGAIWMIYTAIRFEAHPLPFVLLGFCVPYSFLWYYFERVRHGKHLTRRTIARNGP
jgi:hypothetical protein